MSTKACKICKPSVHSEKRGVESSVDFFSEKDEVEAEDDDVEVADDAEDVVEVVAGIGFNDGLAGMVVCLLTFAAVMDIGLGCLRKARVKRC